MGYHAFDGDRPTPAEIAAYKTRFFNEFAASGILADVTKLHEDMEALKAAVEPYAERLPEDSEPSRNHVSNHSFQKLLDHLYTEYFRPLRGLDVRMVALGNPALQYASLGSVNNSAEPDNDIFSAFLTELSQCDIDTVDLLDISDKCYSMMRDYGKLKEKTQNFVEGHHNGIRRFCDSGRADR